MTLKNRLGEMEPCEAKQISEERVPSLAPRIGLAGQGLLLAGLLLLPVTAWAQPAMNMTPNTVDALSTANIQFNITGITAGSTVRIERFNDTDNSGYVDSYDPLVQSFLLTDGVVTVFNGVRDINIPGDENLSVDGAITAYYPMKALAELARGVGHYLFRVSSPTAAFAEFTVPFTITQTADGQSISGNVTSGASPVPYAMVGLLAGAEGEYYMGVMADGAGNYTVNAPPGFYTVMPIANGYVTDFSSLPSVILDSGVSQTDVNLSLTAVTNAISGQLIDSVTLVGVPGVQVAMENVTRDKFALTFTKADGTFVRGVTADNWSVDASELSLPPLGYLRMNNSVPAVTTGGDVSGLNISLTKSTALVYGTVTNASLTPIAGLRMYASDPTHTYDQNALTDSNGYYVIGVTAGTWDVGVNSMENPALTGYLPPSSVTVMPSAGQSAQANFTLSAVSAHLQGAVLKDGSGFNWGPSGLTVTAFNNSGQMVQTTSDPMGNFDLGVYAGTWTISLESSSAAASNVVSPVVSQTIADGQTITGVNLPALSATAQINGTVTANSTAVAGAFPYARATINELIYNASGQTDGGGSYSLPVANGTWLVGVTNSGFVNPLEQEVTVSGSNQTANFILGNAPIITAHPADQNVSDGVSAFFTVYTTGGVTLTYQWEYSTNSGGTWSNVPMGAPYSGVMISTLWMQAGTGMNGYMYRCVVSNGAESVTSNAATLTVDGGGGGDTAPSVIAQPSDQTVTEGQTAFFTAAFNGSPTPELQWQVSANGGSTWDNLTGDMTYSGVNSVNLSAVTSLALNGYLYRCVGTNSVNSATTNSVTLTVNASGSPLIDMVTIAKARHYVQTDTLNEVPHSSPWAFHVRVDGSSLSTLTAPTFVTPAGSGTVNALLAYDMNRDLWHYDFNFSDQASLDAAFLSGDYVLTVDPTPITLNLTGDAYPNAPEVAVTAGTWSDGVLHLASTQAIDLTTNAFTNYANIGVYLISHIQLSISGPSYSAMFEVESNSTPGTNLGSLNVPANSLTPGETYTVTAVFDGGVDMKTTLGSDFAMYSSVTEFQIVVDGPSVFSVQPVSQSVAAGQDVVFGVNASGNPAPTFQWIVSTDGGTTWNNVPESAPYSGATSLNLSITGVTAALSRNLYACVASNGSGSVPSNAATLHVAPLTPTLGGFDDFSASSNWSAINRTMEGGGNLVLANTRMEYLVGTATDDDGVFREWTANVGSYTQDWAVQVDVHLDSFSLTGDQYVNLNLAVYNAADAVVPRTDPAVDMIDIAIDRYADGGNTIRSIEGDLQGNGARDPVTGMFSVANSTTDAALRISFNSTTKYLTSWYDADGAANGYNWVMLQNIDIGSGAFTWGMNDSSTFGVALAGGARHLAVSSGQAHFDNFSAAAPRITTQPQGQAVPTGGGATLSVVAAGDGPFTYQWHKDFVAIDGATGASLNLTNFQDTDSGAYRVTVTDTHGVTLVSNGASVIERKLVTVFPVHVYAGSLGVSAAYDGTNYLVPVQGDGNSPTGLMAQLISSTGSYVGSRIPLVTNGLMPKVAYDGANYLMVWAGETSGVHGQLINPSGTLTGTNFPISAATPENGHVQMVYAGGSYLVCWASGGVIYGQWVATAGTLTGDAFALSGVTTQARDFNLSASSTQVLVTWSGGGDYRPVVYGQLLTTSGLSGGTITIDDNTLPSDNPIAIASDGTDFLVVFPDEIGAVGSSIWQLVGQRISSAGALLGSRFDLAGPGTILPIKLAYDGTDYLLSFSNRAPQSAGCLFRFISGAGVPGNYVFALFPMQDSQSPVVAVPIYAGGQYFIPATYGTWSESGMQGNGVYGAFYNPAGAPAQTAQTITFDQVLPDIGFTATPITLTATASSGLTVTYLVTGPATVLGNSLTLTGVGTVSITAQQAGDAGYYAAPDVPRSFNVTANYASWQLDNFTALEIGLMQAEPNAVYGQDGLPNLVKYALGLDPKVNATSGLPEVSTDATHWLYTYSRPTALSGEVTYVVEYSTNLTTWSPLVTGVDHVQLSSIAGTDVWQAKYLLTSAANVYFRLKVTK